ncbi:hypothetical protein [Ornithinimicrobium sp. LYQ103]|uniref:hypothetical protein n=1 Tax=Ornithinimicrobium sp. LYQ103 TaxID=3378796 RepID=UPI0038542260
MSRTSSSSSGAARQRQQRLARWARGLPGYRLATQSVLPRVRGNPLLVDLAWRVFSPGSGAAGQLTVPLHAGRHVGGPDVDRLPVVGVLGLGLTDDQATGLVDRVADLQRETVAFRPVLVLDRPAFAAARRHGFVLEHVVPRDRWTGGGWTAPGVEADEGSWEAYLARRLGSVIDHYRLWHLVTAVVGPTTTAVALRPVDEALLRHLADRLPADLQVHRQG